MISEYLALPDQPPLSPGREAMAEMADLLTSEHTDSFLSSPGDHTSMVEFSDHNVDYEGGEGAISRAPSELGFVVESAHTSPSSHSARKTMWTCT